MAKILCVIQIKFNQFISGNLWNMIINLSTRRIQVISQQRRYTEYKSFTNKMVAKKSWHGQGTKFRHCHPIYVRSGPQWGSLQRSHRPPISALLPQFTVLRTSDGKTSLTSLFRLSLLQAQSSHCRRPDTMYVQL